MTPLKKVYVHSDEQDPGRVLEVRTNDSVVRVTCDAAGLAAVSHVMPWQEWEELVLKVRGSHGL